MQSVKALELCSWICCREEYSNLRISVLFCRLVTILIKVAGLLFVFGVWFWEVFKVMDIWLWDVDDADAWGVLWEAGAVVSPGHTKRLRQPVKRPAHNSPCTLMRTWLRQMGLILRPVSAEYLSPGHLSRQVWPKAHSEASAPHRTPHADIPRDKPQPR